jgi:glutathione S-transferase
LSLIFYGHPFSSYCQKVEVALYENGLEFDYRIVEPDRPEIVAQWVSLWPMKKFPILVDAGRVVAESSIIIEHLHLFHPGPSRLLPDDAAEALEVRFIDRFFDNHVMTPVQQLVGEALRANPNRLAETREKSGTTLNAAYGWLDERLQGRRWAAGERFSMADCAAAPSLFYADWVHAIGDRFATLRAYRSRLLERPSFARAVDEGRPYRHFLPLGAPHRD